MLAESREQDSVWPASVHRPDLNLLHLQPAVPPPQTEACCTTTTMSSTKVDGTVAAAQQLGSMSLGESVERKDNDTEPTAKNNGARTKLCSACGKNSDALQKCRACKCVWYCDKDCQNRHWKEHKKECKPIKMALAKRGGKLDLGTEEDVGPLGKVPPREECPICMRVLPIYKPLQSYYTCCGKTLCGGCDFQHQMKSGEWPTCAFCRTTLPKSDEEKLARLSKRVERKDPQGLMRVAMNYGYGELGLPVDQAKCIDLLRQSAGLGFPSAQYQLGNFHRLGKMGLQQNEEEALRYFKEASEGGHLLSLHNLGCMEEDENGDHVAAMRHWQLSASGGSITSTGILITCFEDGLLQHSDLAESLQAMYRSRNEMRSEDRDMFVEYLKMTGEYKEQYDF